MIIQDGTMEFKTQVAGVIDPETGYRSQPVSASWCDPMPCNIQTAKENLLAKALGGEHFTEISYEVCVEEDTPTPSERVRLKDTTGKDLGEFSVQKIIPLEAVAMKKILV